MGTGAPGPGGSGARGGEGIGRYSFGRGGATETAESQRNIQEDVSKLLGQRATAAYFTAQFTGPAIDSVYRHLMAIALSRDDENPFRGIATELDVDEGPRFLVRLAQAIAHAAAKLESDRRLYETARLCLEDFLVMLVGNDLDAYTSANCNEVSHRLDRSLLGSTLGYFLANLVVRVIEREMREVPPATARSHLHAEAERRVNRVIVAFEERSAASGTIGHRDFFGVVKKDPSWLLKTIAQ